MTVQAVDYYWLLPDGRIWSSLAAGWVSLEEVPFDPEDPQTRLLIRLRDMDHLRDNIRFYGCEMGEMAEAVDLVDDINAYEQRGGGLSKVRFSKKDFLMLCGIPQIVKLNTVINSGNALAQTVHDLLFAADYIDVTDKATVDMVELLTTEAAGSVLTAEQAAVILQGVKYESADNSGHLDNPDEPLDSA